MELIICNQVCAICCASQQQRKFVFAHRRAFAKRRHVAMDIPVDWRANDSQTLLAEVLGNSELVVSWLHGSAAIKRPTQSARVPNIVGGLRQPWRAGHIVPRIAVAD
jgi:hypothetical protein